MTVAIIENKVFQTAEKLKKWQDYIDTSIETYQDIKNFFELKNSNVAIVLLNMSLMIKKAELDRLLESGIPYFIIILVRQVTNQY